MSNKELLKIATGFRKGMLNKRKSKDWCVAVSLPLAGYLNFCGINCSTTDGMIGNYQHCWITLGNGTIIDATADQFKKPDKSDMPPVYIGNKPSWYKVQ